MISGEVGQRRCLRSIPTLLVALIAALAAINAISTASASAASVDETRVGAHNVAVDVLVGPPEHIAAGQRLGEAAPRVVGVVATGVAAKAADGAVGRLPFPIDLVPKGMKPGAYGNQVWGVGPDGAKALMGARTADELRALGLTPQGAARWRDFYANELRRKPGNPSAAARIDLMNDIIKTLGGG